MQVVIRDGCFIEDDNIALNARQLDYHGRLIVDSVNIKYLRCVLRKMTYLFSQTVQC